MVRIALVSLVASLTGCGLLLDPSVSPAPGGEMDASADAQVPDAFADASIDANGPDATPPPDAAPPTDTAPPPIVDAATGDATACAADPCDVFTQCGCDGDQHCVVVDTAAVECHAPGPTGEGGRCSSYLECARGLTCGYVGSPDGVCVRYCRDDTECSGPGSRCLTFFGPGAPTAPIGACSASCNPILDTGCDGLACRIGAHPVMGYLTYCGRAGTYGEGEACSGFGACEAGVACVAGTCRRLCRVTADCGAGMCSFAARLRIGTVDYGACVGG